MISLKALIWSLRVLVHIFDRVEHTEDYSESSHNQPFKRFDFLSRQWFRLVFPLVYRLCANLHLICVDDDADGWDC